MHLACVHCRASAQPDRHPLELTTAEGKQIILERSEVSEALAGQYVDLYDFGDGWLEVRTKGRVLPYLTFHKDQRVNPAAIVENKRLGHALGNWSPTQKNVRAPEQDFPFTGHPARAVLEQSANAGCAMHKHC